MSVFISLLRGINVGGQKKIRMVELTSLYQSLALVNAKSYLQSGNVLFESSDQDTSRIALLIEAGIEQNFGYAVSVLVRETHYFQGITDSNPFLKGRNEDTANLYVTFLYGSPSKATLSKLHVANEESDEFYVGDNAIFLYCPTGYGRTRISNNFFERKLKMPATTRHWNTVTALYRLAMGNATLDGREARDTGAED